MTVADSIAPRLAEARQLAKQLQAILEAEGENNFVRGVRNLRATLESGDTDATLQEAAGAYRSFYAGYGSFSDYYIERANFDDRVRANEELDRVKELLWAVLRSSF